MPAVSSSKDLATVSIRPRRIIFPAKIPVSVEALISFVVLLCKLHVMTVLQNKNAASTSFAFHNILNNLLGRVM